MRWCISLITLVLPGEGGRYTRKWPIDTADKQKIFNAIDQTIHRTLWDGPPGEVLWFRVFEVRRLLFSSLG